VTCTTTDLARLFVYGTLMRGQEAAAYLRPARFLGVAETVAGFALLDLGDYPGLIATRSNGLSQQAHAQVSALRDRVRGELFEIPVGLFAALDDYEGHPELFLRTTVDLEGGGSAQTYLFQGEVTGRLRIPSGDWRDRVRGSGNRA